MHNLEDNLNYNFINFSFKNRKSIRVGNRRISKLHTLRGFPEGPVKTRASNAVVTDSIPG